MPSTGKLTSVAEVAGTLKQVEQAFTSFQVVRNQFVATLQGFLGRLDSDKDNVLLEALMKRDVLAVLCCPLAADSQPGIQAGALECLGKVASADPLLAQSIVSCGVLDSIVHSVSHESSPVQAAADNVLSSIASSTTDFARRVLEAGALSGLLAQLQDGTPPVKEAAVVCLQALVNSDRDHARLICNDALLGTLVTLLRAQSSPPRLCRAVVNALAAAASYGPELANAIIRARALQPVCLLVHGSTTPWDLRTAALTCLTHVAAHNEELAGQVVAADDGLVAAAVGHAADRMVPAVRRAATALLLQLARKTHSRAEQVAAAGAPSTICRFLQMELGILEKGSAPAGPGAGAPGSAAQAVLSGVTLAGTVASYDPALARAVDDAGTSAQVILALQRSSGAAAGQSDAGICTSSAWALEQMAAHGADIAGPLVLQGALTACMDAYVGPLAGSEAGVKASAKAAVKALIHGCTASAALEALVTDSSPPEVLKHTLARCVVLLGGDAKARQAFVTSGALMRLQVQEARLQQAGASKALEHLAAVNALFPSEVVSYYRQGMAR